jgi:predicted Zn-dependent protease
MVVLHEYGHLLGLGHSEDPNDVMYPVIRAPIWPCKW